MTTSILSEAVTNAFKYPDNESFARNLNHVKKLKILGVCNWIKPLFLPVCIFGTILVKIIYKK